MFCNKAKTECHKMNCRHAGRHKKTDACYSKICVEFDITVTCLESTLSDEYADSFEEAANQLDKLRDEALRAADAIVENFDDDEDDLIG